MADISYLRPVPPPSPPFRSRSGHRAGTRSDRALALIGAVGLLVVASVHLVGLSARFTQAPYIGVAYVFLIAGSAGSAFLLLRRDDRGWMLGGALSLVAILVFIVSRTVGLPAIYNEIGQWSGARSIVSLAAEGLVTGLATRQLRWVWQL